MPRRLISILLGLWLLSGNAGAYTLLSTKWDPGANTASFFAGEPMTPGGATWSVMPAGTAAAPVTDLHGGATSVAAGNGALITGPGSGTELAIYAAALDVWAAASGFVNLGMVADSGAAVGTVESGPGNTLFGDIRIGAYSVGYPASVLAHAYQPGTSPMFVEGSIGGDTHFDSTDPWVDDPTDTTADADIDLFTVALHEFGHALGLGHSLDPTSVMFASYSGARRTLSADDIAGITAIYGAPLPIPEPGTALMLATVLGLFLVRRRQASADETDLVPPGEIVP